ncbi:STAS-like domain-containing protein [Xylophilus sp. GW821-FHT01B05]
MTPVATVRVNVAKQFTRLPGLRYMRLGSFSGEEFRQKFLIEPMRQGKTVIVELDGVRGYGSSFLEEAFGGTVRELDLDIEDALQRLKVDTSVQSWQLDVDEYIRTAKLKKSAPGV